MENQVNNSEEVREFKFVNIGGKYVASTYFNTAFNNFFFTIEFILKQVGVTKKVLNILDWKEEKVAEVLQYFYDLTFDAQKKDEVLETLKKRMSDKLLKEKIGIKKAEIKNKNSEQYRDISPKDIELGYDDLKNLEKSANDSAEKIVQEVEKLLALSDDKLLKFQKLLFNKIPGFAPMMAEVVSHENKKVQDKKDKGTSKEEKEQLKLHQKGMTYETLFKYLILIAKAFVYYRNFYTHKNPYNTPEEEYQQNIRECKSFFLMKSVFDSSRRIDKRRNLVSTQNMKDLTGNGKNQRKTKVENGYIESDKFYFKIIGDSFESSDYKGHTLSDFGRMFFCCLFLSNHDVLKFIEKEQLMEKSPFKLSENELKNKQEAENDRITKENQARAKNGEIPLSPRTIEPKESITNEIVKDMLCVYHIRLPREKRIDSQETESTLVMDMLNELRKCPSELYETFSPDGKRKFEKDVTPDEKNGTPEIVKMIRHTDRFPHLALRYIDETKSLDDIRFQVRLGCYRYCFYNKICVDGKPDVRVWQKEINGFGLYKDIEAKRKQDWADKFQESVEKIVDQKYGEAELLQLEKDKAGQPDYVTDVKTSYNIHANRIGMTWGLPEGIYFPSLGRIEEKTNEKETYKAPESKVKMIVPKCTMSIYELPALLFYQYLYDEYGKRYDKYKALNAATIIKNKYEGLVAFFCAVKKGTSIEELNTLMTNMGINQRDLPQSIITYLNDAYSKEKKDFALFVENKRNKHVIQKLSDCLSEVQRRKKVFEKKNQKIESTDNKVGSKGYEDIRHGTLARYLAKSFVMWQPTKNNGKDKITGLNYNKMMSFLAAYGQKSTLEDLKNLLKSAKLLDGEIPHPFLDSVLNTNPQNTEALYRKYLNREEKTINNLLALLRLEENVKDLEEYAKKLDSLTSGLSEKDLNIIKLSSIGKVKNQVKSVPNKEDMVRVLVTSICNWIGRDVSDSNLKKWLKQVLSSANVDSIKNIIKQRKQDLLKSSVHPFLQESLSQSTNFEELYIKYLTNEKELIESTKSINIPFAHEDATKWKVDAKEETAKYYKDYAARYLKMPDNQHDAIIMLPDGLFKEAVLELLSAMCDDEKNNLGINDVNSIPQVKEELRQMLKDPSLNQNMSYVIQSYFKKVMDDENQSFYTISGDYKRAYEPFTKLYGKQVGNTTEVQRYYMDAETLKNRLKLNASEIKKQFESRPNLKNIKNIDAAVISIKSKINEVKDIEKRIRRYKTQDVMLFLCARKLLINILSPKEDKNNESKNNVKSKASTLKLQDFNFDKDFNFLSEGENGAKVSYTYEYKNGIKITQQGLSLKNYGNIYRVLSDPKLDSLMKRLKEAESKDEKIESVTFNDLTSEFAKFEDSRPRIFETIHELEDEVLNSNEGVLKNPNCSEFYKERPDGSKFAKRNSFSELVKLQKDYDSEDASVMVHIRNAVGHGHYDFNFKELKDNEKDTPKIPEIASKMESMMKKRKNHECQKYSSQPKSKISQVDSNDLPVENGE